MNVDLGAMSYGWSSDGTSANPDYFYMSLTATMVQNVAPNERVRNMFYVSEFWTASSSSAKDWQNYAYTDYDDTFVKRAETAIELTYKEDQSTCRVSVSTSSSCDTSAGDLGKLSLGACVSGNSYNKCCDPWTSDKSSADTQSSCQLGIEKCGQYGHDVSSCNSGQTTGGARWSGASQAEFVTLVGETFILEYTAVLPEI